MSMTFSRSVNVSSGEINILWIENWKRRVQRVVCSSLVVYKYIDKEQSPVTKGRVSVKMSLIQNIISEILIG